MIVNLGQWCWARTLGNAMLAALKARPAAALLTTPTLVLRTDAVRVVPETVFADIVAADFSGYADLAVTPSDPVHEGLSAGGMLVNGVWIATDPSPAAFVPNTVTGVALTDGVTAYYGGAQFDEGVGIAAPGDYVDLTALLGLEWLWSR